MVSDILSEKNTWRCIYELHFLLKKESEPTRRDPLFYSFVIQTITRGPSINGVLRWKTAAADLEEYILADF